MDEGGFGAFGHWVRLDHVGALRGLAEMWDVPIYAHPLEFPYLTGKSSYPPPDPAVGGGAMSFLSRLYPRGPADVSSRLQPLPRDGTVPGMPGWRWIHTPGYTPGHVALFRDTDRLLIAGDAFVTQKQESALAVMFQPQVVSRPPAYYTTDWAAARRSVETLSKLKPNVAATGHGIPMQGVRMREELAQLLQNWNRDAVPLHGRYFGEPAIADEEGVRYIPPAVHDPQLLVLAGIGALRTRSSRPRRQMRGNKKACSLVHHNDDCTGKHGVCLVAVQGRSGNDIEAIAPAGRED